MSDAERVRQLETILAALIDHVDRVGCFAARRTAVVRTRPSRAIRERSASIATSGSYWPVVTVPASRALNHLAIDRMVSAALSCRGVDGPGDEQAGIR